jgi:polyisoprenoid-binding protein YceI
MKTFSVFFAAIVVVALFSFAIKHETLKLNTQISSINWLGKKTIGEHSGTLKFKSGEIVTHNNKLVGGSFVVDMNSLVCTDITDAKSNGDLVGHLKNADFFDVAKHPTAAFKITKVEDKGSNNYKIAGDMTIKGISKPISFDGMVNIEGATAKTKATVAIDRTQFDIKFKSKTAFPEIGDKFIYDEFTLELNMAFQK